MVFPSGENDAASDYHKNMDADTLVAWLQKHLVPVFIRRYPHA